MSKLPTVAIIGRANVGKSSLFNYIVGDQALVTDIPGTTRDTLHADYEYEGKKFTLVDTGGLDAGTDEIAYKIIAQAEKALSSADLILFVVDTSVGLENNDKAIYNNLRKNYPHKKVFVIGNKTESAIQEKNLLPLYELGVDHVFPTSAVTGWGLYDLLDEIVQNLPKDPKSDNQADTSTEIKVGIIGEPNVGKSSILNALAGDDISIVSAQAHTTQTPQNYHLDFDGNRITFIDTAGMRRQARVEEKLETLSVKKSLQTIEKADIIILVVSYDRDFSQQMQKLSLLSKKARKPIILVANKWDLIPYKTPGTITAEKKKLRRTFPELNNFPVLFVSATEKQRIQEIPKLILKLFTNWHREISDEDLQKFIDEIRQDPRAGVKHPDYNTLRQYHVAPPRFELAAPKRSKIGAGYFGWLERKIREKFDFEGVPIFIQHKKLTGLPNLRKND